MCTCSYLGADLGSVNAHSCIEHLHTPMPDGSLSPGTFDEFWLVSVLLCVLTAERLSHRTESRDEIERCVSSHQLTHAGSAR